MPAPSSHATEAAGAQGQPGARHLFLVCVDAGSWWQGSGSAGIGVRSERNRLRGNRLLICRSALSARGLLQTNEMVLGCGGNRNTFRNILQFSALLLHPEDGVPQPVCAEGEHQVTGRSACRDWAGAAERGLAGGPPTAPAGLLPPAPSVPATGAPSAALSPGTGFRDQLPAPWHHPAPAAPTAPLGAALWVGGSGCPRRAGPLHPLTFPMEKLGRKPSHHPPKEQSVRIVQRH